MSQTLTPILTVAAAGLIAEQGLAPSANLISAINSFNSSAITAATQNLLISGNTQIVNLLATIPPGLSGIVTANLRSTVPSTISSQFNFNNLVADVNQQINAIMSGGIAGLSSVITRVQTCCVDSFDMRGMFMQMQEGKFEDFGATVNSYTDILTGGVSSQFAELVGGLNNTAAREMLTQLGTFGTMFDIREPGRINEPKVLCQNLINQGFYLVNELLTKNGIDVSNLAIADEKQLLAAMKTVAGAELAAIISVTDFKSYGSITNLADVLNAERLFSPRALTAAGGSLSALANKLINVGGKFRSFKDLSDTYLKVKTTATPNLTGIQQLGNNSLFASAKGKLSSGSGIFGNPNIFDYIGVITGQGYVDEINSLTANQTQIISTFEGNSLKVALETRPVNPVYIAQAIEILTTSTNPQLQQLINDSEIKFNSIFNRLLNERKNSKTNGINYTETINTTEVISSFVLSLHDAWNDQRNLKYGDFIRMIVTNDIYGEAIRTGIDEGYNLALLSQKNIPTYTKLDPVAYSTVVQSRPDC
jgi:hypothetical protein